jgi:hypothetical protein
MNSTVGISPYFTIPKGVDRIEGGFGGSASHGLITSSCFLTTLWCLCCLQGSGLQQQQP